ncbi:MAG: hypothetical protein UW15_C0014G0004 [Parcubacteria group bacterium GW2011_GWC1_44_10]|uniref:Uncharacterized protein n=2 Tax=Candidatus Giovannoniibacteriota TaxID=1752738 RepID=A0A0G1ICV6_9BACT|nr:MAG: hypothetical protein UW15_C0014G0004 [Parcubacteria group bacterium GW2011_GWC1_44_10]KKT57060.1 MAG: hypothetical protein UW49_C0008G0022 [Candidatus Giovannonibacteria bacterium GW2011_GWB1_44_23]KKT59497.1 MAG: hypothetical protein UW53_C0011G0026 [Candidatus Giovannonibacteria bacterium GW2011_GWA1_44_25]
MTWLVNFSAQAEKFLEQQQIPKDGVYELVQKALMRFRNPINGQSTEEDRNN